MEMKNERKGDKNKDPGASQLMIIISEKVTL